MNTPQTLKGFRDFLPEKMAIRKKVIAILESVFERYGFAPLQTPTLEYAELLLGKYGEEADKLVYTFEDRGGRMVGLNYDLTVPTARVLAQYPNIPKPFKRYQIQSSYRAENTQKGRYRQFTQCDIDIVGVSSPLADAEIVAVIYEALTRLGFSAFEIRFNSRALLYALMKEARVPETEWATVLQTVDKLDKVTPQELDSELEAKGLTNGFFTNTIAPLLEACQSQWTQMKTSGDAYLDEVYAHALTMNVDPAALVFSPNIVRGLDYYTGPIFETVVSDFKIGSVTGGGRYDKLIESLGGPSLPAVGTTIGLDRICDCLEEQKAWSQNATSITAVLVTIVSPELKQHALSIATTLRKAGLNTELYPDEHTKLEKQLKYADSKHIPYVILVGEQEKEHNTVLLKNLETRKQEELPVEVVIDKLTRAT